MSRFCVEIVLSSSIEKLHRGDLSVFHKFSGIEIFYGKEGKRRKEGGNIKSFRRNFCLTIVEKFGRGTF